MRSASGKFVIRLPPPLHERLRTLSQARQISLNELCATQLEAIGNSGRQSGGQQFLDENAVRQIQKAYPELLGIVLFGSAARNEATQSSDIDLLLVVAPAVEISRKLYRIWDEKLDHTEFKKISPHFVGLPDAPLSAGSLWFEVALDGKILWERGNELARFLYRIREAMAAGKIQRQLTHGHPYWIRKQSHEE